MLRENYTVVQAQTSDYKLVLDFINTCPYYFHHLDWHMPVDWLGTQPYYIAYYQGQINAVFVCPYLKDPQVWIRCFSGRAINSASIAWQLMLEKCCNNLSLCKVDSLFSISLQEWYTRLLLDSGFHLDNQIVVLENQINGRQIEVIPVPGLELSRMQPLELNEVWELDRQCFQPLWQMSREDIMTAFHVSENCATIRDHEGRLIGYQISNSLPTGGHLARIAVHPNYQGKGVGRYLLQDLLQKFIMAGVTRVTVNTQIDNRTAIQLYESSGFIQTGEKYPVFRLDV
jgi:ribosomal protein S18 acetylase RimI-like enzyme